MFVQYLRRIVYHGPKSSASGCFRGIIFVTVLSLGKQNGALEKSPADFYYAVRNTICYEWCNKTPRSFCLHPHVGLSAVVLDLKRALRRCSRARCINDSECDIHTIVAPLRVSVTCLWARCGER